MFTRDLGAADLQGSKQRLDRIGRRIYDLGSSVPIKVMPHHWCKRCITTLYGDDMVMMVMMVFASAGFQCSGLCRLDRLDRGSYLLGAEVRFPVNPDSRPPASETRIVSLDGRFNVVQYPSLELYFLQ